MEGAYPSDSVAPLAALRDLVRLRAGAPAGWRTLSALTALEMVEMYRARLADLRPLSGWQHLRSLTISMGSLASLEGIEAFSSLESLTLVALRIPDLGPLSGLPALAELSLLDVDGVRDIGPVGTLPSLRRLAIRASPGGARRNVGPAAIATLRPLAGLARLETLELRVGVEDGDLGSLADLAALRRVELTGAPGPQVARLRAARPDLDLALHDVPAGPAGVAVAGVTIHPPAAGQPRWWIFEDLAERLGTATNADAETLVRLAITARDAALSERVRYDAEAGGVAIEAPTEADIRSVAAIVGGLSSALR